MPLGRGRPGLLGRTAKTMARTAVIAGTATAVSGRVAGRDAGGPAGGPDDVPPGLSQDAIARLQKLAELRDSGVLTDAEFTAQKALILG